jgi:hypothetical protein
VSPKEEKPSLRESMSGVDGDGDVDVDVDVDLRTSPRFAPPSAATEVVSDVV